MTGSPAGAQHAAMTTFFPIHRLFFLQVIVALIRVVAMFAAPVSIFAQPGAEGSVAGVVIEGAANRPVEFVAVVLKRMPGGVAIAQAATDRQGRFVLANIPDGEYQLSYGHVGADTKSTAPFVLNAQRRKVELGQLDLADAAVKMDKVEVQSTQAAFLNSIDRKTYNVGKEIQSATGSASDLLQNIPSVQVDTEGAVSLRGSENVMILINGRTSTLMGANRDEALQQLSADGIERIEVITNPSAKYKPDGTAGIINIVLKQKRAAGFAGTVSANVGNEDRYNAGITANYNPGKYNVFGNVSLRQEDRRRFLSDSRERIDPDTGAISTSEKRGEEHSRPLTRLANGGFEYTPAEDRSVGATFSYDHRTQTRRGLDRTIARNSSGAITSDYDRTRDAPEFERSLEFAANYLRKFAPADHELKLEVRSSRSHEKEANRYADIFRTPAQSAVFDNTRIKNTERETELIVEYIRPLGETSKLEAGYTGTLEKLDADFFGEALDPVSGQWVMDATKTNRFINEQTIHAFYATYGRTIGKFGFLAGLRPEFVEVESRLVTAGTTIPNDYARVYPSLHLAYRLTEQHEIQLNYSHRVERPDIDELNPFPEYSDPFNLRAGNPALLPENVHSIEAGYGFQGDRTTLTAVVYHRQLYNGFTTITRDIGNGVLLTTEENLARSNSTGFELTADGELAKNVSLNFSSNTFFNTINASNLGYATRKSDVSWSAKLGATVRLPGSTLVQFNTNYQSSRLTPQGTRRPSFVANIGLRKDIMNRKMAVVLTVSDIFNSRKDGSVLDTPTLRQEIVRRRSSRVVYAGLIYHFGKSSKKPKEEEMKFDDAL